MKDKKIVILAGRHETTSIIYNHLKEFFSVEKVILEQSISKKIFLKRRIKKLGLTTVAGQVLFRIIIVPILKKLAGSRKAEIFKEYGLDATAINEEKIISVESVNSDACIEALQVLRPDVVVINGTRIISKKVLESIPAKFINTHAGITPKYRGAHGGYWALANDDVENFGVTVHLVDQGIDTGDIVSQGRVIPTKKDSFVTYPYLQEGIGLPLLRQAIADCFSGAIETKHTEGESMMWHHPTFWGYVYQCLFHGVK